MLALLHAALLASQAGGEPATMPAILSLREQAEVRDRWLGLRLQRVLPGLMTRTGIDLWIVSAREYAEDPVLETMLPATWLRARRRTILVFGLDVSEELHDGPAPPLECLAVSRYGVGRHFQAAWDPEEEPDQWRALAKLVEQRDPRRIALDVSPVFALADGLSASERDALVAALPAGWDERIVSAEELAVGWLETRTDEELEVYPSLCRMAHAIIAEGLSERAVQPGVTTTTDLEWWFRERVRALGLDTWFHPSVTVQRARDAHASGSFADQGPPETIRRGDLVHVDFGITYLGLNTDTQQHAYVLRAGESEAPSGLRDGLATANRLQDILIAEFATGRTGNQILLAALARAREAGIAATIYTHPLGYHGHGAGPLIGLWDRQEGVPGAGDYPLWPRTAFAIELNAVCEVPEWDGQEARFMLEEDAVFDGRAVRWLAGRQIELLLIR